jgi:flavin reductase (DIM6/NTAB) family NADH-FMN oxidoreductase RutF
VQEPDPERDLGTAQRDLFRRWPAGVSVVVAESGGRRAGLTISSLVSLSLEPPLVAISLAHVASLYEVLREAGAWCASILGGEQDAIAQHFARSVPPLVLWDGIPVRDDDPRWIADAVGWLRVRTIQEVVTGDHTLFVGEVLELERGPAATSLVYLDRRYWPL